MDRETSTPLAQDMTPTINTVRRPPRLAAALRERFAQRAVLEKQVNANLEGMGYGG